MHIMHIFIAILGILLIYIPLQDGFETIILPRRVARRFRLARLFYILTWALWSLPARKMRAGNRREYYLALFGPLSLVLLLILWAALLILGYACLQWGLYSQLNTTGTASDFGTYLYLSGTTFITLGLGDILPISGLARALVVIEAGTGFGFLALVIGYLPVIYQAFSRREASITLLDARAGSPPSAGELLRRHTHAGNTSKIIEYMHEWEHWCSEILESHISYNVLIFYRSQHPDQSWLGAITAVLDTCALILAGIEGVPIKPIKFTFAIARHAAVDLALILDTPPVKDGNRLPHEDFVRLRAQLAEVGLMLKDGEATEKRLAQLRGMYEPFVEGLARRLLLNLPRWMKQPDQVDDWQTSAWDHFLESSPRTLDRAIVGD